MQKAPSTSPIMASEGDLMPLSTSWGRHLRSRNLSPRTVQSYLESVQRLASFLADRGMPTDVRNIRREHVESFIDDVLTHWKPTTAGIRYASLRVFFGWLVDEGEVRESPMARMRKPKQDELLTDIPSSEDIQRLLASFKGRDLDQVRDTAIVLVFLSTGARLAEVAGLRLADVDLDAGTVVFMGKGRRQRRAYLGRKGTEAVDRYVRRRRSHPAADSEWLWLGAKGRLTASGISQRIRDRGAALGMHLHPHKFRHWYADSMLAAGHQEGDIMALAGWRSREMLARYASARREDRALAAARRLTPADDL